MTVVPSRGKIGDDEHPMKALRQKPESSILQGTELLKSGMADALVSMGSTGASMATRASALSTYDIELILVGDPQAVEAELARYNGAGKPVTVVPSRGKIGDDEHPMKALRQKPESSILQGTGDEGRATVCGAPSGLLRWGTPCSRWKGYNHRNGHGGFGVVALPVVSW